MSETRRCGMVGAHGVRGAYVRALLSTLLLRASEKHNDSIVQRSCGVCAVQAQRDCTSMLEWAQTHIESAAVTTAAVRTRPSLAADAAAEMSAEVHNAFSRGKNTTSVCM